MVEVKGEIDGLAGRRQGTQAQADYELARLAGLIKRRGPTGFIRRWSHSRPTPNNVGKGRDGAG